MGWGQVPGFLKSQKISQGGGGGGRGKPGGGWGHSSHTQEVLWASPLLLGTQGGSWQGDQMEGSGPGLQGGASTPASEDLGLRAVNQHWGVQPGH